MREITVTRESLYEAALETGWVNLGDGGSLFAADGYEVMSDERGLVVPLRELLDVLFGEESA